MDTEKIRRCYEAALNDEYLRTLMNDFGGICFQTFADEWFVFSVMHGGCIEISARYIVFESHKKIFDIICGRVRSLRELCVDGIDRERFEFIIDRFTNKFTLQQQVDLYIRALVEYKKDYPEFYINFYSSYRELDSLVFSKIISSI